MQFSLFDDRNLGRIGYLQALKQFDLPTARKHLLTWQKTLDATPDVEKRLAALDQLQQSLALATENRLEFLVDLFMNQEAGTAFSPLAADVAVWREGLISAILLEMNGKVNGYLTPKLHSAEFYIWAGQLADAEHQTSQALKLDYADVFVQQLHAWALFHLGRQKEAFVAATGALFLTPDRCRPQYLLPGDFRKMYDYLLPKLTDSGLALRRLPFVLWRDGKTYLEAGHTVLTDLLEQLAEQNRQRAETDAAEQQRQFNRLLYLAEAERLTLRRGATSPRLDKMRGRMRALNEEWFGSYVASLTAFGNY